MSVLVYETDIGVWLNRNAKFANITFKTGEAMITIEIDGVGKVTGSNSLLVQEVADKSWPVVKAEAAGLVATLKKDVDPIDDDKVRGAALKKELGTFVTDVSNKLIAVACRVFTAFAKDKKDYKVYRIKSGLKITVNGAMLAASIGLTAAAGWTGVGTVVGAVGMARSLASIAQQCVNLSKDSMDIHVRIVKNVAKMRASLASPSIKANTARQAASTVFNKVFAVEIEVLFVTVGGIETDVRLLKSKMQGNKVNATKLADGIPKMLDDQKRLADEVEKLAKLTSITKKQVAEQKTLEAKLAKNEADLDKLLGEIHHMMEFLNYLVPWVVRCEADITALKGRYNPKIVTGAGLATDFLLAAGSFAAGNFNDPAGTIKDLHDASKVVVTSLAITNDGLGVIKDIGTSIYDACAD